MVWRIPEDVMVERIDGDVVVLVRGTREAFRITGDSGEVIDLVSAGATHLPDRLHEAAQVLTDAGIVVRPGDAGLSRRRVLAIGAVGAAAVGVQALALPTAAHASSSPTSTSTSTSSTTPTTTTTMPVGFGTTWTARSTPASGSSQFLSMTYGGGTYVAVGSSSGLRTSSDGISWTAQTPALALVWQDVTYGNGLFVAVATSGTTQRVMTSPDGVTWTARTTPNQAWRGVAYGTPGITPTPLFVAVAGAGTGNRVMTSSDGETWTGGTTPLAADTYSWNRVTYGNGRYVAVGSGTSGLFENVMTSPDGVTWTLRTTPTGADINWTGVAYGEPVIAGTPSPLFVAVARTAGVNNVMTSPDGETWTLQTVPVSTEWRAVAWGGGLFVAVGLAGKVITSPDGVTWTEQSSPISSDTLQCVAYGNLQFAAMTQLQPGSGNGVITSP